ncbi:MAG: SAM-dependent methyltransferase [Streptosporangiaceae bacterium]
MSNPEFPDEVDRERPSVARLYDYFLGGTRNFAADRELARELLLVEPNARYIATENRAFLGRAVRYLLCAGIRQFIDLGSGIPTQENVHEIAQKGNPEARVVYVDNDPVAVAHSKHILGDNANAAVIEADIRDPWSVIDHPLVASLIDFSEPVGLLMVTVLQFVPDRDDPVGVCGKFASVLASGSYLAISHAIDEAAPGAAAQSRDLYNKATASAHIRTRAEIMRVFGGFDLVKPGLVYLPLWRPDGGQPDHPELAWIHAGVGRKTS